MNELVIAGVDVICLLLSCSLSADSRNLRKDEQNLLLKSMRVPTKQKDRLLPVLVDGALRTHGKDMGCKLEYCEEKE